MLRFGLLASLAIILFIQFLPFYEYLRIIKEFLNFKFEKMAVKEQPVGNINAVSRISAGTVFKGEIESKSDIRIDGTFEGKITTTGRVVVGEGAFVKGEILCDNADIFGKVEGSLTVRDVLSLKSACEVKGDLEIAKIAVELGSSFDGTCKMLRKQPVMTETKITK